MTRETKPRGELYRTSRYTVTIDTRDEEGYPVSFAVWSDDDDAPLAYARSERIARELAHEFARD